MNIETNGKLTDKDKEININYHAPLVFAIPRPYEDNYERNNGWYLQMLKLEKKTVQIKKKIQSIAVRYTVQSEITKQIIEQTKELNNRFIKRPQKDNSESCD